MSDHDHSTQKHVESYRTGRNTDHSDDMADYGPLHRRDQQLSPSRLTTGRILQLQRQIGNQAVQRLLNKKFGLMPAKTIAPIVQREVEDIGNNQVTALISDVKTNGAGTFITFDGTKYWIDRFPSRDTFEPAEKITFTLDATGLRKTATAQNIKQKIEQGMQDVRQNQINQEEDKRFYEDRLKRNPPRPRDFRFKDSTYKHCATGQGDSDYVGRLSGIKTEDYVIDYVLDHLDKVIYVGPSTKESGSQEYKLVLGGKESIVFSDNGRQVTVFHVGPSLA